MTIVKANFRKRGIVVRNGVVGCGSGVVGSVASGSVGSVTSGSVGGGSASFLDEMLVSATQIVTPSKYTRPLSEVNFDEEHS